MTEIDPPLGEGRRREEGESPQLAAGLDELHEVHEMSRLVSGVTHNMRAISSRLDSLGLMRPVSEALDSMSEELREQMRRVVAAGTARSRAEMGASQESFGKVIMTVLDQMTGGEEKSGG